MGRSGHTAMAMAALALPVLLTGPRSAWTATRAPLPADAARGPGTGSPGPTVAWVACLSGLAWLAVGGYTDSSGHLQGLLLAGYGSTWTAIRAPLPAAAAPIAAADAGLWDVSCPAAAACVAVGYYTDSSGGKQGRLLPRPG